ncbi:MAG: hypothetical protein LCH56_04305 [Proteobacteria bacterium]|nr:hypothetical protein [Pseudomonadota bacterium]MCA0200045.1 hypothetical protein [Pseudomonadota bacterium]
MTEVVTSYAASPQLNLLAQRQQGFGISASSIAQPDAPTAESNALQSALAASDKADDKSFASELPHRDASASPHNGSGPSRPRVEIKQFDVGLSAAEVVGTQDVLQRFDANGDGRVDTLEADKAALVRQKVFTFAGLAAAPHGAPQTPAAGPTLSEDEAPALARETGAAIAALSTYDESGLPKKFSASIVQDPGAKKFFSEVAEQGAPAGVADAPKKYYGQGAEVVVAGQANNGTNPPVKYADRAPVKDLSVSEEGTGEVKYYDRVAQAEGGDTGAGAESEGFGKYSEKAEEIAAAYAALQDGAPAEAPAVTAVTA